MMKVEDALRISSPYSDFPELKNAVLARISRYEHRQSLILRSVWGFVGLGACASGVYGVVDVARGVATSDLSSYASLVLSDSSSALVYWRELLFSITESLPTLGITLMLGGLFVALGALRSVFRQDTRLRQYPIAQTA